MNQVRAKKHLGQHFLRDESIAERIADSLIFSPNDNVLEIGPGMGVMTKYCLKKELNLKVVELDKESVVYLEKHYPSLKDNIISADFLKLELNEIFNNSKFHIVGNFPYNISSQILFKMLDYRDNVPSLVGMFQKEVAERVAEKPGSKTYGILSVLIQAFYNAEYLFTVDENVFIPPPKVKSGVIRLTRNNVEKLPCNEKKFFELVKTAFNQRRKTIRNSIKSMSPSEEVLSSEYMTKRAEQLSVNDFINLCILIEKDGKY